MPLLGGGVGVGVCVCVCVCFVKLQDCHVKLFLSLQNLYKDGISMLGEDKLQEIVDLMIEKELRVHLPVEELDILME